ncbi:50S ribosomal protein L5 [bacterium]|nr:50S ribosomal protein L5 [candidate division CSSED10-310 bacterium]
MKKEPTLRKKHREEIIPLMIKEFSYDNIMEAPKLVKIVLNAGLGEAIQNHKILETTVKEFAIITGQKPVITRARKSIAGFKIRRGMPIGCSVTLRGDRMYEFLERLVCVTLPRVRDFRGVSPRAFDGHGNYTLGLTEQLIFPEIEYDKVERINGLSITIVTTAKTDEEALFLLKNLGMPFRN